MLAETKNFDQREALEVQRFFIFILGYLNPHGAPPLAEVPEALLDQDKDIQTAFSMSYILLVNLSYPTIPRLFRQVTECHGCSWYSF